MNLLYSLLLIQAHHQLSIKMRTFKVPVVILLLKQEKYFHREFSNIWLDTKDLGWGNQVFHC